MIWNTPVEQLRFASERADSAGMLLETTQLDASLRANNVPYRKVRYMEIPPAIHAIGKLVVPFVSLDARGTLVQSLPSFYAVTRRPNVGEIPALEETYTTIREAHVHAEDLALRRGIATPYGRTNSEIQVAEAYQGVVHETFHQDYGKDRVAHLLALHKDVTGFEQSELRITRIAADELLTAVDSLRAHFDLTSDF